jgi:hypothetical protein
MPTSPTDNTGTAGSQYGTGSPYYGSGFTNFDRYLQDTNLDWGAKQNALIPSSNDWAMQTPFDNWMINRAHPEGLPVVNDPGTTTPGTRPPGPAGDGRQPAFPASDKPFTPNPNLDPAKPAPPRPDNLSRNPGTTAGPFPGATSSPSQPAPSETNPTGGGQWQVHVPDPRIPGGYNQTYNTNDPRLPADQRGKFPTAPTAAIPTDPRLPATPKSSLSAFPTLDKKLQQGGW